jgi:hypothetical protein
VVRKLGELHISNLSRLNEGNAHPDQEVKDLGACRTLINTDKGERHAFQVGGRRVVDVLLLYP